MYIIYSLNLRLFGPEVISNGQGVTFSDDHSASKENGHLKSFFLFWELNIGPLSQALSINRLIATFRPLFSPMGISISQYLF